MSPAAAVLGAWLLFGGSHLLLSGSRLRTALSGKLGERGFIVAYTAVAAVSLLLLAVTVAHYGDAGRGGPDLAMVPGARWGLGVIALIGAGLATAGLVSYSRSPMAVLARRARALNDLKGKPLRAPGAVERITRHPFFVGIAILMGAHVLLASTLAGAVYFAGFSLLALLGIPMQDRKLRDRHGEVYAAYLRASSAVPFAAARRSFDSSPARLGPALVAAVSGALLVALLHPVWRVGYGAPFAVLVAIGGVYAVIKQFRRIGNAANL